MAEQFEVWPGFAYPIPDHVSFGEATFLDGLAVAIHACDRAAVVQGAHVAIVGLGPIGMLAAQVARSRGASVSACGTTPLPLELATGLGFTDLVQADAQHFLRPGADFDSIIDTVGAPGSLARAPESLAPGGALALLSVHPESISLPTVSLSAPPVLRPSPFLNVRFLSVRVGLTEPLVSVSRMVKLRPNSAASRMMVWPAPSMVMSFDRSSHAGSGPGRGVGCNGPWAVDGVARRGDVARVLRRGGREGANRHNCSRSAPVRQGMLPR